MLPLIRRWRRTSFFAFGFMLTAGCGWLLANWLECARVLGISVSYDTRPPWLRGFMIVLEWLPVLVLGALVILRATRGPVVRPIAFAGGGVLVWALVFASLFTRPAFEGYQNRRDFEPGAWRRNERPADKWPARLAMVDDLMARHPLRGLSRDSVDRLLGPRDSTEYFREWHLVYWLGPERSLIGIDSEWLVIRFGPDGRVRDSRIVRD